MSATNPSTTFLPQSLIYITSLFSSLSSYHPPPQSPPPVATATATAPDDPISPPQAPRLNPSLPSNPLLLISEHAKTLKPLLTTIHLLFPNEFLPALDLLDRRLIPKLLPGRDEITAEVKDADHSGDDDGVYVVQSSTCVSTSVSTSGSGSGSTSSGINRGDRGDGLGQHQQQRYEYDDHRRGQYGSASGRTVRYEVRLQAWNCTCPAFVLGCFGNARLTSRDDAGRWTRADGEQYEGGHEVDDGGMGWVYGGLRITQDVELDVVGKRQVPVCKHLLACLLVERCPLFRECVEVKMASKEKIAGWSAGWGD